ncbi:uncharacterized protein [Ptychodera flava]|uniref:uncharacterized protein n=1 Tax=Ptychodera flava TaxID=63121 RepID=UPI00396A86EE
MVSMDVVSLHSNIPNEFGIQAVKKHMIDRNITNPPPELISEMLTFILNRNYFEFNGKFFLQTMGTAMGTMTAPSYANIAMGQIEDNILKQAEHKPEKWKRFIDDVRFLWNHGLDKLLLFHEYSNTIHPTIKFTINYSTEKLPFLDTTMINENGKIATTIYTNPTDKHSYLW